MNVLNIIARKNESKTLKSISSKCRCKFDERKFNSNQNWNNNKCRCESNNKKNKPNVRKKYIFGMLIHVLVKKVNF